MIKIKKYKRQRHYEWWLISYKHIATGELISLVVNAPNIGCARDRVKPMFSVEYRFDLSSSHILDVNTFPVVDINKILAI